MEILTVLAVAFFVSVFSTVFWLIYAVMFVAEKISGIPLNALSLFDASIYLAFILLPVFVLWAVFGYINQFSGMRHLHNNLFMLFKQMKKNMDYTDLVARIMLEAEQEIKDGFILNKFDVFIADMNELLAEIIRRTGIASNEQIENLWTKVQNGGKWSFGKVLIEVNQNQPDFQARVFNRGRQDVVLGGSLMEFCARYQSLIVLLEKHDKEHVFLNLVETGVFGKVYSIITPIADEIRTQKEADTFRRPENKTPAVKIDFFKEKQQAEIKNEKPEDNERNELSQHSTSLAGRFKLFKKKHKAENEDGKIEPSIDEGSSERDPFTLALERSFGSEPTIDMPGVKDEKENIAEQKYFSESVPGTDKYADEPWHDDQQMDIEDFTGHVNNPMPKIQPKGKTIEFKETQNTLKNLRKEWEKMKLANELGVRKETQQKTEDEQFNYPFGGWANEANRK